MKNRIKHILRAYKITQPFYPILARLYFLWSLPGKQKQLRKNGYGVLKHITHILEEKGVCYFVDFGTLLGMIREGGFLGHDCDIDIGVIPNKEKSREYVRDIMLSGGFVLKQTCEYEGVSTEDSFIYDSIKVDIFYYCNDEKMSKCWFFYFDWAKRHLYPSVNSASVFELTHRKISEMKVLSCHGVEMKVPANYVSVLEDKYGKNWQKPDKNWKYWRTPGAVECQGCGTIIAR